ncbi:SDR family NAD(P)-dependent oxidoreductase [Micromonospora sp. C31]|uniref:type I polyketide synthase n=1 Tax=Micromonospora sp. C31 TaxID=2824876 RepID=UPI001B372463|nr:type I polyketide synthase [Micromonospora sp. C31]MBQ1074903.1 SDR family NAD(P)-dependent oxidoreductase [Micromonospora sp. C31]
MSTADVTRLEQYLRRATTALVRTEKELEAERGARTEPIAIVAQACRLPGADTPEEYWSLLAEGRDAISGFPARWAGRDLYDPDPEAAGKSYAREGGFISDVAGFDADFFGISQREASGMDPQQRLVLETTWEALERAGIRPGDLAGTRTGVYLGAMASDYGHGLQDLDALDGYVGTGKAGSVLSGRVSYTLGLQGPAVTVDTACSSSLVAVHLAVSALRSGECDVALAGGVTVMSSPYLFVEFSRLKAMSPDGRCKSFSASADGAGWSEGCGVLVLKRLSSARADGDRVLALVRGSAVNQDGRSQGLTAPNGPSQRRVVRDALVAAGLSAGDVDAVEAHGTGTVLGDPIEAGALGEVFGSGRSVPVWLGSAKSNIGHAQAAAGVAGVIKMVLALGYEVLPRTLHVDEPSRLVDWGSSGLELLTRARVWRRGERVRRAGVSSFGLSGTNAHLILEEAPAEVGESESGVGSQPVGAVPVLVSGRDAEALRAQATRWADWLEAHPDTDLTDLARTAAVCRTHHRHRAALVVTDPAEAVTALRALAAGTAHPAVLTGTADDGGTAVLFTGQGSQRPGMGQGLRAAFPVFRDAFDAVAEALRPHLDRPLTEILDAPAGSPDAELVHQTAYTQAALFAFEVALYRLWESWGIHADMLAGHSIGELAAAHVAGILDLPDAARLVAARGRLMQACPPGGAMVSVEATEDEVATALTDLPGVAVAGLNGPRQTVVSGDNDPVTAVAEHFAAEGRRTRRLTVSHAFHSPHMDPMLDAYAEVAAGCRFAAPAIPVISTVTGERTGPETPDGDGLRSAAYWVRQARDAVRFLDVVGRAEASGIRRYLECGPAPVLAAMAAGCLAEDSPSQVATGLPGVVDTDEVTAVLAGLAQVHVAGGDVDWSALAGTRGRLVDLPTYAFQRRRFWVEPARGGDPSSLGLTTAGHPWLGAVTSVADDGDRHLFTGTVSTGTHPWLRDHRVHGAVLVPGTGLLDLATAAARHVGAAGVGELTLLDPLVLPDTGTTVRVQVTVGPAGPDGARPLTVHSRVDDGSDAAVWRRHAEGSTVATVDDEPAGWDDLRQWPPAGADPVDLDGRYAAFAAAGLDYGPAFRGLVEAYRTAGRVYARVDLPEPLTTDGYTVHPALLDAALHAVAAADPDAPVRLPFSWHTVRTAASGATRLRVRADVDADAERIVLRATDAHGTPVLHATLVLRAADPARVRAGGTVEHLYRLRHVEPGPLRQQAGTRWTLGTTGAAAPDRFADLTALTGHLDAGHAAPDRILVDGVAGPTEALPLLHGLLGDARLGRTELLWRTNGAVAVRPDDPAPAPEQAALAGLLRAARAEHPERGIRLVDAPAGVDPGVAVPVVDEPELVLRDGVVLVPRLTPAGLADEPFRLDPDGTVLITGGTGDLGRTLAAHLVGAHRVRRLVLTSRRGTVDGAAAEDLDRLRADGAQVDVVACDVTDRDAVAAVLARPDARWTAVFHLAGVIDDGLLAGQDPDRIARVMAPKLTGARHLDEATRSLPLAAFVLFSSVSGLLGGAGQAGYAAGNAALDALATARRAAGLPATALVWGMWQQDGGMTAGLGARERAELRAGGVAPLTTAQALGAFDAALAHPDPVLVPVRFDLTALRRPDATVPALLRALVRTRATTVAGAAGGGGLRDRLAALPRDARLAELVDLVSREASAVLGGTSVAADQVFADAGLDSVMAMQLRRRLVDTVGVPLPATIAFDHPSAEAVAALLLDRLDLGGSGVVATSAATAVPADAPIAVVAMACRLPGGVVDPEGFWDLLAAGRDAVGPFPERWAGLDLYDPDPAAVGRSTVREGGFLDDVAGFDHDFFGVSPREAVAMDPQQRLVLEAAWEALERARVRPGDLYGSRTGVYLGTMGSDYGSQAGHSLADLDGYYGTGNAASVLSGRVAYTLGLQGPAVSVDTACSSSLVALHLAASALRAGECELALAGGVTVMSTPTPFVEFSRLKGLSSDGRCHSFSADADGTGWAEGCGVLVLKPLAAAQRDGDPVLAVLRGSAVNSDGRSQGLTAPNGPSQQRVVRDALAAAGLRPADVDAVEAHGTGTALGDPIEAGALAEVFGPERATPLLLGSVKSNLGHTQAAAGVVSVIKMVLALHHETLPPTLHVREPSPLVDWTGGRLELLTNARPWPRGERVRRAGVSSFGLSGTNAHVVIEEAPVRSQQPAAPTEPGSPLPVPVSGHSEAAVRAQAGRWADWLAGSGAPLVDLAYTAARLRTHFPYRAAVIAEDAPSTVDALRALADGRRHPAVRDVEPVADGEVALLFTGQGAQRVGMGRTLHRESAVYRDAFDAVCAALDPHLPRPLREVVFADPDSPEAALLHHTEYAQPALFATEVALHRLLVSLGVAPAALAGHSVGELAAAHVAGILDLPDAARLVAARGRLMQSCPPGGAMVSIEADEQIVRAALPTDARIAVAGVNGPRQTVVSGDADLVTAVAEYFVAQGRRTKRLTVSHAFHSPHMEPMLDAYAEVAAGCRFAAPEIPVVSTVTGEWAGVDLPAGQGLRDPGYWVRQVRREVRFLDAVTTLEAAGIRRYLECGPGPVLAPMAAGCVAADSTSRFTAGLTEDESLAAVVAAVHRAGVDVDWSRVLPDGSGIDLPTYAFQRTAHWLRPAGDRGDLETSGLVACGHPWLVAVTPLADGDGHLLTGRISAVAHPWLRDHVVHGSLLVPGTGLLDLALAAVGAVGAAGVQTLTLAQPLVLDEQGARRLQVRVSAPDAHGERRIDIHSRPDRGDAPWTHHAHGHLTDTPRDPVGQDAGLRVWPVAEAEPVPLTDLHPRLAAQGLAYGPAFRGLTEVLRRGNVAYGRVVLPAPAGAADGFGVHPALLDAALHTLAAITDDDPRDGLLLPFTWLGVRLAATGATELRVRAELTDADGEPTAVLTVADAAGEPVAEVTGLALRRVRPDQLRPAGTAEDLYRVEFRPVTAPPASTLPGDLLLLGPGTTLADAWGLPAHATLPQTPAGTVVVDLTGGGAADPRAALLDAFAQLRAVLGAEQVTGVVWVTADAVAARPGDPADALENAGVWGLVRAARAEHPDRPLRLVDLGAGVDPALLAGALAGTDEPEIALRGDQILVPRLVPVDAGTALTAPPTDGPWRVEIAERGSFDALRVVAVDRAALEPGAVRVRVRAAGVNFRDVLNALDVVHAPALGLECAGEVVAVGADVTRLRVGQRVTGLAVGAFGTEVDVDARLLVPLPDGLDFAEAATLPLAYLTAHHALVTRAGLRPGQRLLVHAAAGGVGMAAVHLARHLGLEVWATASVAKWPVLRALGIPAERIASSRDTDFADRFLAATGGQGVDAVLNALAGEFVDASLRLLPRGGHFLEMGKTDVRDAAEVEAAHPGVRYAAFDLMAGGNDAIAAEFAALGALPAQAVRPLRHTAYDVRETPEAFRLMAQGRHVGKLVLTTPRPLDPDGTVLLTGGTGGLGRALAAHVVRAHGARHLLVASRRGSDAPDARELIDEVTALGAETVRVLACDVADRAQVAAVLDAVDPAHPLTAVLHLAAVLDDGVLRNLTQERFDRVLAPKLVGAAHLHELTVGQDLAAFVLFSSLAGTLGAAGQGNYAAANAYLDALAAHRRARGLAGVSLAWGPWTATGAGMTGNLDPAELARVRRQGILPIDTAAGLRLFDAALARPYAHQVPVRLLPDAFDAEPPALLRALVRRTLRHARATEAGAGLVERLAPLDAGERVAELTRFVQHEAGLVLGLPDAAAVGAEKPLRDLGWDSLMAVELRNRLAKATGTTLPTSLTYDYPTVRALAEFLDGRLGAARPAEPVAPSAAEATSPQGVPADPVAAAHWAVTRLGPDALRASGILGRLLELARPGEPVVPVDREVDELTIDEIDQALDAVLGKE